MNTAKRLTAFLLALLLLAPVLVQAAEPEARIARQEDLDFLVSTLEEVHPDLYANTTAQAMAERIAYIEENMDGWDDLTFAMELQTLVAMVGDSHTQLSIGGAGDVRMLPLGLKWMAGKWILTDAGQALTPYLGWEITGLGGLTMEQVQEKLDPLLSADNAVKARRQFAGTVNVWEVLAHCGVVEAGQESAAVTLSDGTQTVEAVLRPMTPEELAAVETAHLSELRASVPETDYNPNVVYSYNLLRNGAHHIIYNQCREVQKWPITGFADTVHSLMEGDDGAVLVDLRYNGGGSDGVFWPVMLELLRGQQKGKQIYVLIGEQTFSAAVINAVQLQQMGAVLVGEPTSGSVSHFGAVQSFRLPNSGLRLGVSTKFIDLGEYYAAAEGCGVAPLQPDILAEQTVEDYLNGVDTAVAAVMEKPPVFRENTVTGTPETVTVRVNGRETTAPGYRIEGDFYAAIRDTAALLSGTAAQFDLQWHAEDAAVEVLPGKAYTAVGGELSGLPAGRRYLSWTDTLLTCDQMPLQLYGRPGGLRMYDLDFRHYARLTDLAGKLGFTARWSNGGTVLNLTA